ncbi:MAG: hypothetical protein K6F51_11145 [Acetatifactor sp.]|nr:hypothetical protein [Acetatifactor sp.]
MKKFRTLLTIACMALVMMVTCVKARAMEGSGTVDDPYIVTDYAEFAEKLNTMELYGANWYEHVVQEAPPTYYFKLGQDIYSEDKINDDMILSFGRARMDTGTGWRACSSENFVLDLAGHLIKRKTKSTDYAIIYVNSGTLTIEDSIGGGKVESEFDTAFSYGLADVCYTIFVRDIRRDLVETYSCNLVINGGEFYSHNGQCIYARDINGSVTINDGIFDGVVQVDNVSRNNSSLYVNGGTFSWLSHKGEGYIRDCSITERLYAAGFISSKIDSNTIVTVDGKRVYNLDENELEGNIVITDPTKPKITSQPSPYVFPYVGASQTFRIFAENAESYEWHVRDDKGIDRSWEDLASKGIIQLSDGHIYNNMLSLDKANVEDRLQLYCVVRGNGYVLKSKPVDLTTEPLIKEIRVEIENFDDAVVGANIGDFTKVNLDHLSHGTASDATWYNYYEPAEGKMEWGESYEISFSVDLDQGYELDPKARCIVKTPKGDVVATKLAGSNETHANFEFSYEPPRPENGIKIESVSRSVKEPVAGEAPAVELDPLSGAEAADCPYAVQSMTWNPSPESFVEGGQYVLIIVYKAKDGYGFYDDTEFFMNGNKMIVDEVVKGSGGTAKVVSFIKAKAAFKITKKSLTLYDTIAIDFKIPKESMEGYHDPFLLVTMKTK